MSSSASPYASHYPAASPTTQKIAIPRLPRPNPGYGASKERRRVPRACTACRSHKIKCSGDSPVCKHCYNTGRDCIYILPRKDRLKIITDRCLQMAALMRSIRPRTSGDDAAKITDLLEAVEEDLSNVNQGSGQSNPDTDADEVHDSRPQEHVDVEPLDLLDENLHENDRSRATGFMGNSSEVQWLRALMQLDRADEAPSRSPLMYQRDSSATSSGYGEHVSLVTFYLDTETIDPAPMLEDCAVPSAEMAERLLAVYMDKVHTSFPILPRVVFENQFKSFFDGYRMGKQARLNEKWQAILNLVFAIAAKHSPPDPNWPGGETHHSVYQARARKLAWNQCTITDHPDLPQIQVAGLLSFYYLSIGQVSRAWLAVGIALRFAYGLGLHVRNEDPSASLAKREVLVRVWWSLYSLERQLSIITGRPSMVVDSSCSVPLPLPISEERLPTVSDIASGLRRLSSSSTASSVSTIPGSAYSSGIETPKTPTGFSSAEANSGTFFRAVVQLGIISQSIVSSLYTAGTMIRSANEIQQDMNQLAQRLEGWVSALPMDFNFHVRRSGVSTPSRTFFRERTLLAFQYCEAMILLTRASLGGLGQQGKEGKDVRRMSPQSFDAAKMGLDLLPDQPNPLFVYEYGPWWNIVHHLMQAYCIFLTALSLSSPGAQEVVVATTYAKKIIRWLGSMSDPLSQRAYAVAFNAFAVVARRLSLDDSDLLVEHGRVLSGPHADMMDGVHDWFPTPINVSYGVATAGSFGVTTVAPFDMATTASFDTAATDPVGMATRIQGYVPVGNMPGAQSGTPGFQPFSSISTAAAFPAQVGPPILNNSFYERTG